MGVGEEQLHGGGWSAVTPPFEFVSAKDNCDSRTRYVQRKGFRVISMVKGQAFLSVLN